MQAMGARKDDCWRASAVGVRRVSPIAAIVLLLIAQTLTGGVLNPEPVIIGDMSLDAYCAGIERDWGVVWDISDPWAPSSSVRCSPQHPGALVLTLDDSDHLASWWEHRVDFLDRGIRLTMFIDRTWKLNETAWGWLNTFQQDGHEIALHGKDHESVLEHIESGGTVSSFIEQQIIPELERFDAHGIEPTAYAYPDGHRTAESDAALLDIFRIVRATDRWYGSDHISRMSPVADARVVVGMTMDREYDAVSGVIGSLSKAARDSVAIITYGHRLDSGDNPYHTTEPADLFAIAEHAESLGVPMLTISELAEPAHREGLEHMYGFLRVGDVKIAEAMLENCWTLPRFDEICISGQTPTWQEDPYDENYWRFIFYSLRPLRHLLHAWEVTGNMVYRDRLVELIIDFDAEHDASPWVYRHHADKHGAAFRALVLTEIRWTLAHDGALTPEEAVVFDSLILETADYLSVEGNFQSGYNHGFTQAAALLVVAVNSPHLHGTFEMDVLARQRLVGLMTATVGDDGVLVENSPYYHIYILEKVGEVDRWMGTNDLDPPPALTKKIPLMVDYAVHISHPDGRLPLLGASIPSNGIDAVGLAPFASEYPEFAWVRSGGQMGEVPVRLDAWYDSAGQFTWRSGWSEAESDTAHLVFDAGPFRTSHSDLDASNIIWWAGRPVLVDPGLYTYESGEHRDHFQGSSAHNVMVVDGRDQQEGDTDGFHSPTFGTGINWGCASSHHSLSRASTERWVCAIGDHSLFVFDRVVGDVAHDYDLWWHLTPELLAVVNGSGWDLVDDDGQVGRASMLSNGQSALAVVVGAEEPMQGWVASSYEAKVPAPVLHASMNTDIWIVATLYTIGGGESGLTGQTDLSASDLTISTDAGVWSVHIPEYGSTNGFVLKRI